MKSQINLSTTTALPSDGLFDIDEFACMTMARRLSGYTASYSLRPVPEREKSSYLTYKIAVASICHQFNWDFLNKRLADQLLDGGGVNIVERLANLSAREFHAWFSDFGEPDRIR